MNDPASHVPLLQTKQHFEILDGLRGIAAIAVVIFHFMEIAVPDYHHSFIAHAYLSVDFFFCLSGFVIAYAYDKRLPEMGFFSFIKLRLIRLHPLVVIGSLIGLAAFVFDPYSDLWMKYTDKLWLIFTTSCLMIPYPVVTERYFNLFHLNPPTWSLFWEYIANVFYALVLIKMRNKWLWVMVVIGAAGIFYEAHRSTFLGVGWGGDNVLGGTIRVFYSFITGILLFRINGIIRTRLGFLSTGLLLLLVFLVPYNDKYNWLTDPLLVVLYLPFLVALGAGATQYPRFKKICKLSGDISYPLYMIHYPAIWLYMSYVEKNKPALPQMMVIMVVGTIALIVLAWLVLVYMDTPIRAFLKNRLVKERQINQAGNVHPQSGL